MSRRFSQETLIATLVTQSVGPGPAAPTAAIMPWRTLTQAQELTDIGTGNKDSEVIPQNTTPTVSKL